MKKFILYLILAFGLFSQTDATGAKGKTVAKKGQTVKKATQKKPASKSSKSKKGSKKKSSKYSKSKKKSSKSKKSVAKVTPVVRNAQWQMIAQNKEQSRIKDSVQKTSLVQESTVANEGYFASFSRTKKKQLLFKP